MRLRHRILQAVRRFYETTRLRPIARPVLEDVSGNISRSDSPDTNPATTHTCWQLDSLRLVAGWYMLEVVHSAASIGSNLCLSVNGKEEQLLLGSKAECKRLVHFEKPVRRIDISIQSEDARLERVTLVGVTSEFARSRMQQRMKYHAGSSLDSEVTLDTLYLTYKAHIERHEHPLDYAEWRRRKVQREALSDNERPESVDLIKPWHVVLVPVGVPAPAGDHTPDAGLQAAIREAERIGVSFSRSDGSSGSVQSEAEESSCSTFYLPLVPGVQFYAESLIELLRGVTAETIIVYADHDNIDSAGERSGPAFKPAWNPELLLNSNYIDCPWMVRSDWLYSQKLEHWRNQQSLDQVLIRAAIKLGDDAVVRIPEVLASMPLSAETADGIWLQSVSDEMAATMAQVSVTSGLLPGHSRLVWPLPESPPLVDIIVPTRDQLAVLQICVESVLNKTDYPNFKLHIVDNDSVEQGTIDYFSSIASDARVSVTQHAGSFNYSAINNAAVQQAQGEVVVLLNNDTEVINSDWLTELVRHALRPEVGCVGAKLYYTNGRIQHGGVVTGITGIAGHAHRFLAGDADGYCGRLKQSQNFSAVTAACLAVRRESWLQVGGLDETELGVAWNDVDFCLRVKKAGYRNVWTPYAELYHHEGLSRGADNTRSKVQRARSEFDVMQSRWQLDGVTDSAYHPALTGDQENFSLAE